MEYSRPSAEDMFFGEDSQYALRSVNDDRKKRGMFLEPVIPAGSALPEEFPEESVMELQEELFGDEEQPEDDSGFFQQGGF